jgi:hypothetical protein
MKIAEVTNPADELKVQNLDRTAKQATYNLKKERYRQRLNQYNERLKNKKIGAKPTKPPQPPKPPALN